MHSDTRELETLNDLTWAAIAARRDKIVNGRQIEVPATIAGPRQDAESRFSDDFAVLTHLDTALALARRATELAEIGRSVFGASCISCAGRKTRITPRATAAARFSTVMPTPAFPGRTHRSCVRSAARRPGAAGARCRLSEPSPPTQGSVPGADPGLAVVPG